MSEQDPQESMFLRIGPCPHCDGNGEVYSHTHSFGRWSLDPPEDIFVPCEACDGTGRDVIECEPVELEDIPPLWPMPEIDRVVRPIPDPVTGIWTTCQHLEYVRESEWPILLEVAA